MSVQQQSHFTLKWLYCMVLLVVALPAMAQYTKVSGVVSDQATGDPLPFVNISFEGKNIGTTTDINGYYEIQTQWASGYLIASFVGYSPEKKAVVLGSKQTINFALNSTATELKTVEIKAKKGRYKNKENPAVILIKNVIEHKNENRMEGSTYEYFQYDKYEKDEYDINNFTEEWMNRKSLKSFQVLFDYVDTSDINGKPFIPLLIKEKVSTVYIRNDPRAELEQIEGTRISGFENSVFGEGVGQFLDKLSSQVDIYENNIDLLDKSFTSPISTIGPNVYRYYITDSTEIDGHKYKWLSFMPRDPNIIAFTGKMLVADSAENWVVREIELNVDKRININFLEGLRIQQAFEYKEGIGWIIIRDQMTVDIQPTEKGMGIYNTKTISYKNFKVNEPQPDELYSGLNREVLMDSAAHKDNSFWDENRHEELSDQERGIYEMADTIQSIPEFVTITKIGEFVLSGYVKRGGLDIGPVTSFVSYNDVEGIRLRFGGRTNIDFHDKWRLSGYGAYGMNDERWKYSGTIEYYFNKNPRSRLHYNYTDDVFQPGFEVDWSDKDNIFLSFRRTPADNMMYKKESHLFYEREWFSGFGNIFRVREKSISGIDRNPFRQNGFEEAPPDEGIVDAINTVEVGVATRLAINEKFIQGRFSRSQIKTTAPVFYFEYTYSPDVFQNDYEYHKLYFSAVKRFKLGIFGMTDTEIEAAKVFGTVAYPLLDIHRGNESFTYDDRSYNMMNFLEFASDQSVAFMYTHHFNGLLTSQIPLLDRFKLRAVTSGKILFGSLNEANRDSTDDNLLILPERMGWLNDQPYVEVSAGLENIVKLFRLELVKRLTYLDNEDVTDFMGVKGLALRFKLQIMF